MTTDATIAEDRAAELLADIAVNADASLKKKDVAALNRYAARVAADDAGRQAAESPASQKNAGDTGGTGDNRASASSTASPGRKRKPGTPGTTGFAARGGWLWFEGDGEPQKVCSELAVLGRVRDGSGNEWARLLEFADPDGRKKRWAAPMKMLAGDGLEFRSILLSMGLLIAPNAKARQLLALYVQAADTARSFTCALTIGWHGSAFVLPDRTLGTEDVVIQALGKLPRLAEAGTLEHWRTAVAGLGAGNSRLVLAVSAAFAPTLLDPTGEESGGIHLVGPSSTGKTTALRAAASVWGGSDYLHRWRATSNGLEALAQSHNDMLLVLDELAQVDSREAGEIAYMLANGEGKHRARQDGLAKPTATWRLLFLSAGEIGLADHMRDGGKRVKAGQEVRLADVPADAGAGHGLLENLHGFSDGAALADALIEGARAFYGVAGLAFLEQLVGADRAALRASVKSLRDEFTAEHVPAGSSEQVQRLGKRFALVAAAGELATAWGITGWPSGEAFRAAGSCFAASLDRRGGTGSGEDAAALSQVAHFLELHGSSRFADLAGDQDRPIVNRAGYRRRDPDGRIEYLVLPEVFRHEVCAGLDYRSVAKLLRHRGLLVTEDGEHLTVKLRGINRVYAVREVNER